MSTEYPGARTEMITFGDRVSAFLAVAESGNGPFQRSFWDMSVTASFSTLWISRRNSPATEWSESHLICSRDGTATRSP
jgi:hypothetical protein